VAKSIENIKKIASLNPEFIVIDHHFVRDNNYPNIIKKVSFKNIGTAALYMGRQENLLEANRKKLYEDEPVDGSSKQLQDSMNGYLDE
jgi:predicted metallo-beta-lactamase superfamily hydrolase